ncbi:GAF domain-containing protein [Falsiroseomonas sp.]|uniref:GAF domain-containing protein n=1 Tax=Falsiroseomonas sp. TaxID=2870721 RepID=UPI002719A4D0|nr:GAF domain-containing protein [Falsiroseomonas sp.]MDO9503230.1 GAF domain-containing protein [Falsiroseomonas sp.]
MPELDAAGLAAFTAAAREARPLALLQAADAVGRRAMGHRLCTAMRFDAAAMTVRRLYSSDNAAYPVGGAKPKRDTAWGRHVLLRREVFVGEGAEAITEYFDDHALILGLGLRSIVNVPVLYAGACLGTVNFLWAEDRVAPGWRSLAELLGLLVAPDWVAV